MSTQEATRALHDWLVRHEQELIAFLARIVDMDSSTLNTEGVAELADFMAAELALLGFSIQRPQPGLPPQDWIGEAFLGGKRAEAIVPSVVGRLDAGTGRGSLLLLGHLDTAFPPGEPSRHPFRIEDGRAYGPAVADMKGGVAGIVFACRALIETGVARPRTVTVIFNTDEQAGSICSRSLLEDYARRSDWALVTEGAKARTQVDGSRIGLAMGELIVEGVEAHLSAGLREGRSAIEALCRKVVALHRLHDPDNSIIVNVGEFHGGTRRNLYAGRAVARIDVRTNDAPTWERVRRQVEAIAAADDVPGTKTTLRLWQHRPPVPRDASADRFATLASEIYGEMGMPTKVDVIPTLGGSDANITGAQGTPTMDGLGPIYGAMMTANEHILLPSLVERTTLLAALAHRLSLGTT